MAAAQKSDSDNTDKTTDEKKAHPKRTPTIAIPSTQKKEGHEKEEPKKGEQEVAPTAHGIMDNYPSSPGQQDREQNREKENGENGTTSWEEEAKKFFKEVCSGNEDYIARLIGKGSVPHRVVNAIHPYEREVVGGLTALHVACERKHWKLVELLFFFKQKTAYEISEERLE